MQFWLLLSFFVVATLSHAIFLILARQNPQMSAQKRRYLWNTHLWFNGILWSVLFVWLLVIQFSIPSNLGVSPLLKFVGISFATLGIIMVVIVSSMLNFPNLMGLRFFYPAQTRRVSSSLYRVLNNPMYDGFILILVGFALWFGAVEDLYFALASFVLLNILLASVENYEFKWNPF